MEVTRLEAATCGFAHGRRHFNSENSISVSSGCGQRSTFWKIFACFTEETCSDRSLGETQPTNDPLLGCSTWIGFRFVERETDAAQIPYLYFLAFVLVHEWVHCLPTGWSSEIPSVQAQVAFVQTWPRGAMRQRALWYARSLFLLVDEDGH